MKKEDINSQKGKVKLKRSPLYDIFSDMGARFINFAGWELPAYFDSPTAEHLAVRTKAGIFDVSHMGEIEFIGRDATEFLNWTLSNDVTRLDVQGAQYTLILNEKGGIIDDAILYKKSESDYFLCVNAANTVKDLGWFKKKKKNFSVSILDISKKTGQLAIQGPNATKILQPLCESDISLIKPFTFIITNIVGIEAILSRTGYTGENGFEIYIPASEMRRCWKEIYTYGKSFGLVPAGLLARDTLRLEMKYPLHGNDIDETTTPLEACLEWVLKFSKGDFIGREALLKQKEMGITRKLVGFKMIDRGIPRNGFPIYLQGKKIGMVTSGNLCPSIEVPIGIGYVESAFSKIGTEIEIYIRNEKRRAVITRTPFYRRPKEEI